MFYYFNELLTELSNTEVTIFSFIHAIYYRSLNEGENRFFVCSNDYISEKLKISQPTISKAIKILSEKGFIKVEYKTNNIGQVRYITPNLIDLKDIFENDPYKNVLQGDKKDFYNSIKDSFTTPYKKFLDNKNNINKNINNNNLKDTKQKSDIKEISNSKNLIIINNDDNVKAKWNKIAKKYDLATITTLTNTRKQHLKQRIIEAGGEDMFFKIIEKAICSSEFLRGKNQKHWKATFDFFLRQSSFVKSAEGAYNTRSKISPVVKAVTNTDDEISNDELFAEFAFNKN